MIEFNLQKRLGEKNFSFSATVSNYPTGIFGHSGAGKSTLLHMLCGLLKPDSGEIRFGDELIFSSSRGIDLPTRRRSIGLVHQDGLLFPHISVRDNLLYGRKRLGAAGRLAFSDVIDLLEVGDLLERDVNSLSGGERQRIALGRAILAEPRLLLCDEPLASVDSRLKWKILPYLSAAIDTFAIPTLYVSHDQREITSITSQIMVIADGSIIAHGPYNTIIDQMNVYKTFTREQVENTLRATVVGTDWQAGVSRVKCGKAEFLIPPLMVDDGSELTISIRANDIILAREQPRQISTRNCLEGRVARVVPLEKMILLHVDVGCELLVELTPSAMEELALKQNSTVFVLIKTNSFRPSAN